MEFKTIKENVQTEIVEKKSKFISNFFYVENINDAEDILYEYANPINPDILKVGLFFYYDLNRMADAELEAADFTRDEVKEGVQELLKIYDQENFGTIFR